jgi:deoxyribodipyrimidine photo-lyase
MNKEVINVVWLKRDLRMQDHKALYSAEQAGLPYVIIYLFEPNIINYPDTSLRHLQFVYHSIASLNLQLDKYNRFVEVFYGEAMASFSCLLENYNIQNLFSYQESGTSITWIRDKAVNEFCDNNNITWLEFQRDGIIRGLKNRTTWNTHWHATMHAPIIQNTYSISKLKRISHPFTLPLKLINQLKAYPKQFQPAGEENAWRYLKSFTQKKRI